MDPPENFTLTSFCLPASLLWRFRQSRTIPHTKPCWPFRKAQDVRRTTCNAWWQCLASITPCFPPSLSLCRQKAMAEVKTGHAHNASSSCMRLHLFGMLDVLPRSEEPWRSSKDYFPIEASNNLTFQLIKSQSLGIRERFLTPAIPIGQHNASKESKKSKKSETNAGP